MGLISLPTTFADGTIPTAAQFNGDFSTIANEINGSLDNSNIKASAGIIYSKLDSTTVVGVTASQTLTNKTLTTPVLTKPTINGSIQGLTTDSDGATVTFDLAASNIHTVVLGGNRVLALSNASVGQAFVLRLTQDGTGSRTVTWFSTIKWAGGVAPTLTTTINKTDVFGFICTSANNYDGFIVGMAL